MNKKLLIQENDQDIVEILCIALEMEGYETFTVFGYEIDFIALIHKFCPRLVMLDHKLDGRESIRTAKNIRFHFPLLPLVASSCNTALNHTYREEGFNGYLAKPFDLDELYRLLRQLLFNDS